MREKLDHTRRGYGYECVNDADYEPGCSLCGDNGFYVLHGQRHTCTDCSTGERWEEAQERKAEARRDEGRDD